MADNSAGAVTRRSRGSVRREIKRQQAAVQASVPSPRMPNGRSVLGTPPTAADPAPESASEATRHRAGVRLADL
eukprot:6383890-Prymnesium_polylepis.1